MIEIPQPLYLAGRMTGLSDYGYPIFAAAALALREQGYVVLSPHEFDFGDDGIAGSLPHSAYMRVCLGVLLTCQSVVRLPGWEKSFGATTELAVASALEMPIYDYCDGRIFERAG